MADPTGKFKIRTALAVEAVVVEGVAISATAPTHAIYSVSKLNREVRQLLESGIGQIWVQGEISNLARPSSGHWLSVADRASGRCRTRRPAARIR
jgi:exodeoxyribonuclease VII large subunit